MFIQPDGNVMAVPDPTKIVFPEPEKPVTSKHYTTESNTQFDFNLLVTNSVDVKNLMKV